MAAREAGSPLDRYRDPLAKYRSGAASDLDSIVKKYSLPFAPRRRSGGVALAGGASPTGDAANADLAAQVAELTAAQEAANAVEADTSSPTDFLSFAGDVIDFAGSAARATVSNWAGAVEDVVTGDLSSDDVVDIFNPLAWAGTAIAQGFGADPNTFDSDRRRQAVRDFEERTGAGTYLQRTIDEKGWQDTPLNNAVVKNIIGFAGDVGLDPLTYVTGGAGVLGKTGAKTAAKGAIARVTTVADDAARQGDNLLRGTVASIDDGTKGSRLVRFEATDAARSALREAPERADDLARTALRRNLSTAPELANRSVDDLAEETFSKLSRADIEDLAAGELSEIAGAAYQRGGNITLRRQLADTLGDGSGNKLFDAMPSPVRGGVRFFGQEVYRGGGGRRLEQLGPLGKLGETAYLGQSQLRNRLVGGRLAPLARNIGQAGAVFTPAKLAAAEAGARRLGTTADQFNLERALTATMSENIAARAAGAEVDKVLGETAQIASQMAREAGDEEQTWELAGRYYSRMMAGEAPEAATPQEQAALRIAQLADKSLQERLFVKYFDELGSEFAGGAGIAEGGRRVLTDEAVEQGRKRAGVNQARGSNSFKQRKRFAVWDEAGKRTRWMTIEEANDTAGRELFTTDLRKILQDTGGSIRDRAMDAARKRVYRDLGVTRELPDDLLIGGSKLVRKASEASSRLGGQAEKLLAEAERIEADPTLVGSSAARLETNPELAEAVADQTATAATAAQARRAAAMQARADNAETRIASLNAERARVERRVPTEQIEAARKAEARAEVAKEANRRSKTNLQRVQREAERQRTQLETPIPKIEPEQPGYRAATRERAAYWVTENSARKDVLYQAQTGKPFRADMLRGVGDVDGMRGGSKAIFGPGVYATWSEEVASGFGKVTKVEIELENPLVIRTQSEWNNLTARAGWSGNFILDIERDAESLLERAKRAGNASADEFIVEERIRQLRAAIEADGHDGVIILNVDETPQGVSAPGRKTTGSDQVVAFAPVRRARVDAALADLELTEASAALLAQRAADEWSAARAARDIARRGDLEVPAARRLDAIDAEIAAIEAEAATARALREEAVKTADDAAAAAAAKAAKQEAAALRRRAEQLLTEQRTLDDIIRKAGKDPETGSQTYRALADAFTRMERKRLNKFVDKKNKLIAKTARQAKAWEELATSGVTDDELASSLVGLRVQAKDRGNFGTIKSVRNGKAEVFFYNNETKKRATVIFDIAELDPQLVDTAKQKAKVAKRQADFEKLATRTDPERSVAWRMSDINSPFERLGTLKVGGKVASVDAAIENDFAPTIVADALTRMHKVSTAKDARSFLTMFYFPLESLWRTYATVARGPAYVMRNVVGGMWNAFLGSTGASDIALGEAHTLAIRRGVKKAQDAIAAGDVDFERIGSIVDDYIYEELLATGRTVHGKSIADWHQEMTARGLFVDSVSLDLSIGGNITVDQYVTGGRRNFFPGINADDVSGGTRAWMKSVDWAGNNWWVRKMSNFAGASETFLRSSQFYAGLRRFGPDVGPTMGDLLVKATQFDYGDLSNAERQLIRYGIPFFVWTKNNVPLQLRSLVNQPGKVSALLRLNASVQQMLAGDDENGWANEYLPEWMKEYMGKVSTLSFGGSPLVVGLNAPVTDLNRFLTVPTEPLNPLSWGEQYLAGAGDDLKGVMNPFIKATIEGASGTNTFTGAKFQDREVPGWYSLLAKLPFVPDTSIDPATGKEVANDFLPTQLRNLVPPLGQAERLVPFGPLNSERYQERLLTSWLSQTVGAGLPVTIIGTLTDDQLMSSLKRRDREVTDQFRQAAAAQGLDANAIMRAIDNGTTPEQIQAGIAAGLYRAEWAG
jgi:hypothetical protein